MVQAIARDCARHVHFRAIQPGVRYVYSTKMLYGGGSRRDCNGAIGDPAWSIPLRSGCVNSMAAYRGSRTDILAGSAAPCV